MMLHAKLTLLLLTLLNYASSIVVHFEQDFFLVQSKVNLLPYWLSCSKIEAQTTKIMAMKHIDIEGKQILLTSLLQKLNLLDHLQSAIHHGSAARDS